MARARAILTATDDLVSSTRIAARPLTGRLRLGVIPTIAPYLLPRALPVIRRRFPDIALELREGRTETILRELADGDLDLLLLSLPIDEPGIETHALFEDPFLLVTPADETTDGRRRVHQSELDGERLLLLEEGHCLRDQALSLCRLADRDAMKPLGATSLATIVQMVAAGYGVTLVPEMAAPVEVRDERLALMRFESPAPSRTIGLAWRRSSPRGGEYRAIGEVLGELG